MNLEQAAKLYEDVKYLVGSKIDILTIDKILIVPNNNSERNQYLEIYLKTNNSNIALAPFLKSDLTVIFLYKANEVLYIHEEAISEIQKIGIYLNLKEYGIDEE